MQEQIKHWVHDVKLLASIARSEPQYALEYEINYTLLPSILGKNISTQKKDILHFL